MDSLANYGSDDDCDDSSDERQTDWRQAEYKKKSFQRSSFPEKQADANYEEVQMDLSEESNDDGSRNGRETRDRDGSCDDRRGRDSPNNSKSRDDYRSRRGDDISRGSSRNKDRRTSRDDDRMRDRKDDRLSNPRYGLKSERYSRDEKSNRKDNFRDRKYRRSPSREKRRSLSREGRSISREKRRSGSRDRRRSPSREKRYSRSPKRDRSKKSRSRSRSRGRYAGGPSKRYGYPKSNIRANDSTETSAMTESSENKNRFFMPGITGKYREQIEKRKLLWQKKDPQKLGEVALAQTRPPAALGASTSRVTKLWEATTFAQDQDGKVASKFKRLMGIKGQTELAPVAPTDIIKKQEEMFSSMEQQYEVARTATHTMRGVGLGFSSSYPR